MTIAIMFEAIIALGHGITDFVGLQRALLALGKCPRVCLFFLFFFLFSSWVFVVRVSLGTSGQHGALGAVDLLELWHGGLQVYLRARHCGHYHCKVLGRR